MANALLTLILHRAGPETHDRDLTVDNLLNLSRQLFSTVLKGRPSLPGGVADSRLITLADKLSPEQLRVVLYFRLCGRLQVAKKLLSFYQRTKARGIKYTPTMYAFALSATAHSRGIFEPFSARILEDMTSEGIKVDVEIRLALLRGSALRADLDATFRYFRDIELA